MSEAVILGTARTPIGRHGGCLAECRPDDLAAAAIREVVSRAGIDARDVDEVVLGAANQAGEDNRNVARMSALLAGLPVDVAGVTVNRLCASGLEAVAAAARRVRCGEAQVVVAGGAESMTRAPWVMAKPERGFDRREPAVHDTTIGWRFTNPRLHAEHGSDSMGETAENLADRYSITREEQDRFAVASHRKAVAATDGGTLDAELFELAPPTGDAVTVDEVPRRDASIERLSRLRPAFRSDGTVTAGNSSGISDGAAAVLVCSDAYAHAHGLGPLGRVCVSASAGVPPRIMGIGPVPASSKALDAAGLTLADVDLIELNEAFAAQALAVLREWGLDADDARLNPNGGAIAFGHPLGCSGARLVGSALHELQRRDDAELALITMCVGVGQGAAMVLERAA